MNIRLLGSIFTLFLLLAIATYYILGPLGSNQLEVFDTLGGDFELNSTLDKKIKLSDYNDKLVLLNFGYTHCPDICPARLSQLKLIREKLGEEASKTQILFVSFDPERDTIPHLKEYLKYFDNSFIGLTGSKEDITEIISNYGGAFFRQEVDSELEYAFGHSDYIYLIDRNGEVRAFYPLKTKTQKIINDINMLL